MQTRAPPPGTYKVPSFFDAVDQQRQDGMLLHIDALRYYVYHCVSGLRSDEKDKRWKWLIAIIPGWWFRTCFMIFHILGIFIPTDELIFFQRGRSTTNQSLSTVTVNHRMSPRRSSMDIARSSVWLDERREWRERVVTQGDTETPYGGFHKWGTPIAGWFISWKIPI